MGAAEKGERSFSSQEPITSLLFLIDLRDDEDADFLCTSGYCRPTKRH